MSRVSARLGLGVDEHAQPEVEQDRVAPRPGGLDHDVARAEIAVDHAEVVGAGQSVEHLHHEVAGLGQPQHALAGEDVGQRLAGHEREHRVEQPCRGLPRVDEVDDVGVVQLGAQIHLAPEADRAPGGPRRIAQLEWPHQLDRDGLAGGQPARLVDHAEPALTEPDRIS